MGCRGRPVKKIKMTGAERMSLSCQRRKGELETVPRESEPQSNETGSRDIETVYEDERRVSQETEPLLPRRLVGHTSQIK